MYVHYYYYYYYYYYYTDSVFVDQLCYVICMYASFHFIFDFFWLCTYTQLNK